MSNCLSLNTQDWMTDLSLRMCTHHERGVWLDVLCLMHKSERVGVLDWPLTQIAKAAGADVETLCSLVKKGVLKGKSADGAPRVHSRVDLPLTYAAMHSRKKGAEIILLDEVVGDLWYCDWMVIGGHKRKNASAVALSLTSKETARAVIMTDKGGTPAVAQAAAVDSFTLDGGASVKQSSRSKPRTQRVPDCPYEAIVEQFLARFPKAPRPRALSSTSRLGQAIQGMWRTMAKGSDDEFSGYASTERGLEKWGRIFDLAKKSKFLRGEVAPKADGEAFRISIDWLMTRKHVELVLNGYYDRQEGSRSIADEVLQSAARVAEMVARKSSGSAAAPTTTAPAQASIF